MKEKLIQRYTRPERINHWVVAICFVLLAVSGLAFFYPAFFWLTGIFGTPQLARMIHPIIGVVMFLGFARQFLRYWHHNFIDKEDVKWMTSVLKVLKGYEVGDVGKYNGGQKRHVLADDRLYAGFDCHRRYRMAPVFCAIFSDTNADGVSSPMPA